MDPAVGSVYGLPVGAYVAGVEPGYCAQKAGIQAKDIIIAVGDKQVENINDLTRLLREYEPGDKVTIKIFRAGQVLDIPVVLDERPASAG
jgi:S1-C subfamily serine protease